jgi:transcriptional regulator of acetoin/glycerol metabolism
MATERDEPRKRLSRAALGRLAAHSFPGNVRELEHVLISASVFAAGDTIEAEQLTIEEAPRPKNAAPEIDSYGDFKDAERERILGALNAHDWNRAQAARALGMPRRTFYRRLKQHAIGLPNGKG